jgi:hypothetical protein
MWPLPDSLIGIGVQKSGLIPAPLCMKAGRCRNDKAQPYLLTGLRGMVKFW